MADKKLICSNKYGQNNYGIYHYLEDNTSDNYYASEIDKQAIDLVKKRFPSTKQLGNVEEWEKWDLKDVFFFF